MTTETVSASPWARTLRVLVADKFETSGLRELEAIANVCYEPSVKAGDLISRVAEVNPDVLIVRSTRVTGETIGNASALKLIVRAGAGYDTIDIATASRHGIFVANCPGKNAIAVAELAWGLILSCDRRIPDQTDELRSGQWNKSDYSKANGVHGRTLGILGYGTIAREVITRAIAFGMKIVVWSRSLLAEQARAHGIQYAAGPQQVAQHADIVSVHLALTDETKHFVSDDFFSAMKTGAYFINTSRGAIVDTHALQRAMSEKHLRVGLDVFENEPAASEAAFECPLAHQPGFYGTHHVGASTRQAQLAIAKEAAQVVRTFANNGRVANCVNLANPKTVACTLTIRHRNRPGVLAHVFQVLSEGQINVEEMENVLYSGAEAASARIQLASPPTPAQLQTIRVGCEHILSIEVNAISGYQ